MIGGTLLISRAVKNHAHYKKRLEALGFHHVTVTALDKDALNLFIRELQPDLIIMSARFYQCCTPFLMGELKNIFPRINMAAVCLGEYPADLAMYFILNGINSYITSFDGVEQFYKGINLIAKGRTYISPEVMKRIKKRLVVPEPAGIISERHKQVIRLICTGYKDYEIAETLAISRNTVVNHKTSVFTALNVRSPVELVRAALTLEIVRLEEMYFYPKDFTVNPLPKKSTNKKRLKIYEE